MVQFEGISVSHKSRLTLLADRRQRLMRRPLLELLLLLPELELELLLPEFELELELPEFATTTAPDFFDCPNSECWGASEIAA